MEKLKMFEKDFRNNKNDIVCKDAKSKSIEGLVRGHLTPLFA